MAKCKVTISFLFVILIVGLANLLNMSVAFAEVPAFTWDTTEVQDPLSSSFARVDPSIAIDNQNRPHISFGVNEGDPTSPTHIYYAYKENDAWQYEQVGFKPNACAETTIIIDSNNKVHITFATEWGQGIWYTTNKSGSWLSSPTQITTAWTGNYESFFMDDNEHFHVGYWNNTAVPPPPYPKQMCYKYFDGTTWQAVETLGSLNVKRYTNEFCPSALAVTHGSLIPHIIVGNNAVPGGLLHCYKNGSSWLSETFGTGYEILFDANGTLQVDSADNLYCVVQTISDTKSLVLAKKINEQWSCELITQLVTGSVAKASLIIDTQDNLHIAFFNGQIVCYGARESGVWAFQEVETIASGTIPEDISLALDSSGKPRIAYSTSAHRKIYYCEGNINHPPEINPPIGAKTITEGKLLTFTVTAADIDGGMPTYSLEAIPGKNYPEGANIGSSSGIFEWTPDTTQAGTYEIRIKANDGKGGEDYEDVQLTVQESNSSPIIEPIEPKTVKEGETLAFTVSARDPDGDPITYSLEPIKDKIYPTDAALEETSGAFEWTPATGDTGIYYAKVRVADDKGGEDAAALLITIDGTLATIVPPGTTIQYVIDDPSRPYDMIYIPAGTYYEDIIITENVTLRGAPAETTIIKGNITVKNTEATIDNLTIHYDDGYQVAWDDNYPDQVLLADAGITAINANVTVKNCHIEPDPDFLRSLPGNETGEKPFGKGIQIWNMYESLDMDTGLNIENNIIQNADCAVYYFTQSFGGIVSGVVRNNTLYNNRYGVLLRMHKERPEIKNNIIVGGSDGIFLTYRDGDLFDTRTSLMHHNDVWGGTHTYWLDEDGVIFDITGVNGSISEDPVFIDAINGDFTLAVGSPCKGMADDGGDMGVRISLLPAPASPTVSSIPEVTKERYISISGTKDINSSIVINGVELISPNADTEWTINSYDLGTVDDTKTLVITSRNIFGLESGAIIRNVILDTAPPHVVITSPSNGATLTEAPITVTGTVDDPEASVDVNGIFAEITGNTFTAEGVDLRYGQNTIVATAYDEAGNTATDDIIINSTTTSVYELLKITEDTYYGDPDNPVAGSGIELRVKLVVEDAPKTSEPVQFTVTAGNGTLSQAIVNTDTNGEAYVTLTTDTNTTALNLVEAYAVNFPREKVIFSINAKTGQGAQLVKLTDETTTPLPGATISLIVKLTDANNNPIEGQAINFARTQGGGSLSATSAVTNYYGIAEVGFTAPNTPQAMTQITASSAINPSANVIFSITTSPNSAVTVDGLFSKVDLNSQKIHDQIAEMTVTSDDPDKSATAQYKVWQKGDLMKVQNMSTGEITIRPQLTMTEGAPADAQIINYDAATNIYAVKTKASSQPEKMPYTLTYIDYNKGVVTRIESYYQRADAAIIKASLEMTEFVQIPTANNAWVYNKKIQKMYENNSIISTTTTTVTTRQTNVGLADSEFQQ